jgi:hypothetical protein
MGERTRASDGADGAPSPVQDTAVVSEGGWHRSRAGRITQGVLALGIVAALTLVGFHLTQVDAASTHGPAGHQQPVQHRNHR